MAGRPKTLAELADHANALARQQHAIAKRQREEREAMEERHAAELAPVYEAVKNADNLYRLTRNDVEKAALAVFGVRGVDSGLQVGPYWGTIERRRKCYGVEMFDATGQALAHLTVVCTKPPERTGHPALWHLVMWRHNTDGTATRVSNWKCHGREPER